MGTLSPPCAGRGRRSIPITPLGTGGLSPEDENYGGIAIDLAALRAWTVAEENFSLNLARFCPNGDGTFTAFQPVASIAGGNG